MKTFRTVVGAAVTILTVWAFRSADVFGANAMPYGLSSDGTVFVIYDDEVKGSITRDGSGAFDPQSSNLAFSGGKSIRMDHQFPPGGKEGGIFIVPPEPISASGFDYLEFAFHGGPPGTGNKRIEVHVNGRLSTFKRAQQLALMDDGRWSIASIPLSILGSPSEIRCIRFGFGERVVPKEKPWSMYYDSIRLVRKPAPLHSRAKLPELLVNGDMEDGAVGWSIHGWSCEWTNDPRFVKEGKGALRVYGNVDYSGGKQPKKETGSAPGTLAQDLIDEYAACGDGLYEVSGWVKIPAGKGTVAFECEYKGWDPLYPFKTKGSGSEWMSSNAIRFEDGSPKVTAKNADWMFMKARYRLFSSGKATHGWSGIKGEDGAEEFYIDGFSVKKLDPIKPNAVPESAIKTSEAEAALLAKEFAATRSVSVVGKPGTGPGEFRFPHKLAVDASGRLYVADTDNHRIQVLETSGQWTTMGVKGKGTGEFSYPKSVTVTAAGELYVTEADNFRLQKRGVDGKWTVVASKPAINDWPVVPFKGVPDFKARRNHEPEQFEACATDPSGGLVCADSYFNRVCRLNVVGKWSGVGNLDKNYAAELDRNEEANADAPRYVTWGISLGKFDCPRGVAFDPHGNLYVADSYNHRVQKMTQDGKWTVLGGHAIFGDGKWSLLGYVPAHEGVRPGTAVGEFNEPRAVAADKDGYVYVCDSRNDRIQIMNPEGKWLAFGKSGSGVGEFNCPSGIVVDAKGTIYVADTRNHRIQIFAKK